MGSVLSQTTQRSRIVSIDFADNPYHGVHLDDEGELCSMAPKHGTTTCHRYCTAYLISNGKPVTLAMTYVRSDEKQSEAVERVLDRVEAYPFEIELLLADSGFYNECVIRRSLETAATVVPVAEKGDRHKEKLETHKSYMTTDQMYKDSERELRFPLAVSVSYQNGDRGKHGEVGSRVRGVRYGRSHARTGRTLLPQAVSDRIQLSAVSKRTSGNVDARSDRAVCVRGGEFPVGEPVVGTPMGGRRPRRGGRDLLEEFTFSVFCDWIRHALEEELEWRWKIETNGVGVPDAYTAAAG